MSTASYPSVLAHLGDLPNLAVEDALLHALPTVSDTVAVAAIEVLLKRARPHALKHLAGHYLSYPDAVRATLAAATGTLSGSIRDLMHAPTAAPKLAALELIRESNDASLAYLTAEGLGADDGSVRTRAGEVLVELVRRHLETRPEPEDDDAERVYLARRIQLTEALNQAVRTWELHFRADVLAAALWMYAETEPVVRSRLEGPRSHLVHATRQILAGPPDPRLSVFTWCALELDSVREAAARRLEQADDAGVLAGLIEASWLLADPNVERGCAKVRATRWIRTDVRRLADCDPHHVERIASVISRSGIPTAHKLEVFGRWLETGSPAVRRAALWAVVRQDGEGSDALLLSAVRGPDPALAAIAEKELRRRNPDRVIPAASSARPPVRSEPATSAIPGDERGGKVEAPRSEAVLQPESDHAGGSSSPADVVTTCRALLNSPRALDRVRGLHAVRERGIEAGFSDAILRLIHDPDGIVRATAAASLAGVDRGIAAGALRSALSDAEPRVRANAIEALERTADERITAWIAPMLKAVEPRVRANAIKALLARQHAPAGDALLHMLEDSSRAARISALWVVQRLGLRSCALVVGRMGREDPDAHVRRRANRCLSALGGADVRQAPTTSRHAQEALR